MRPLMKIFFRPLVLLWLLLAGARAQIPSPLVSERATAAAVPGAGIVAERRANAALQLDVDLSERVLEAIAEGDEAVVAACDRHGGEQGDNGDNNKDD